MDFMLIVIYIAASALTGIIASNKGRSGVSIFLLSLVFSPLIGLLTALVISTNTREMDLKKIKSREFRRCPFCAELVRPEAIICRYCSNQLEQESSSDIENFAELEITQERNFFKYNGLLFDTLDEAKAEARKRMK